MNRSGLQRLVPIILVIIVIALAGWALVSIGKSIFGGGSSSSPSPSPAANVGKEALTQTTSDRSVQMSVRGPLVADENFHTYTVTISPGGRNMSTYQGYGAKQIDNNQLENSTAAYEQFVYALNRAKLMDGTPLTGNANDTRGICATGTLYQFEVMQETTVLQTLWTTSCAGSKGSLKANLLQITHLFQVQIPQFNTLLKKISLNS